MRSMEDKEISSGSGAGNFEFHKGNGNNRGASHHCTALGKPTPSKWDDAQKWLVGLSRGRDKSQSKTKPRNSNADDRRLIAPVPQKEEDHFSDEDEEEVERDFRVAALSTPYAVETKKVDCDESIWRINRPAENSASAVRSICVRDTGTEMTPIASQEPSRTATPIRATTPAARSPMSSASSTPARSPHGMQVGDDHQNGPTSMPTRKHAEEPNGCKTAHQTSDQARNMNLNPLESRALAWDEAERAKYMARFKREEVKIQAWENHQKRRAEMEMKKMEVKAERLKARAQERYTNKLAATRRIAEERRASAEAKLNEKAVRISEKADYIKRTGHLPSSFSFKLPSLCW